MGMVTVNSITQTFSYDASGNVVSVNYNETEYYYLRNAQNDIVKIIDANGATVVEYKNINMIAGVSLYQLRARFRLRSVLISRLGIEAMFTTRKPGGIICRVDIMTQALLALSLLMSFCLLVKVLSAIIRMRIVGIIRLVVLIHPDILGGMI